MTADPARKLIEEAKEILLQSPTFSFSPTTRASEKLTEALSLLPKWQEFDSENAKTWPKQAAIYLVTIQGEIIPYVDKRAWVGKQWLLGGENVLAYKPLPQSYVKP